MNANIIVRQEFNLAIMADFLFPHPDTCNLTEPRTLTRSTGDITSTIEVSPLAKTKSYNIKTYDVLLAVIRLWEKLGKPDPRLKFNISFRQLIAEMGLSCGGKTLKEVAVELRCLKTTNINWIESFKIIDTGCFKRVGSITDMNILSYLKFELEGQNKDDRKKSLLEYFVNANRVVLQFSEEIANSLINTSIPLNLKVYNSFGKHQYAKIFYLKINIYIFSNGKVSDVLLTATKVLSLLSVNQETSKYKYKSNRKVFLEKLKNSLDKKILSKQKYQLNITIKETTDKKDWLLISKPILISSKYAIQVFNKNKYTINNLALNMTAAIGINLDANNNKFYQKLAKHYPVDFIHRVIAEYKELVNLGSNKENKAAYFTTVFHGLVHSSIYKWINDCSSDCKVRTAQQNKQQKRMVVNEN